MSKFLNYEEFFLNESEYVPTEEEKMKKFEELSDEFRSKHKIGHAPVEAKKFVDLARTVMRGQEQPRGAFVNRQGWGIEYVDKLVDMGIFDVYKKGKAYWLKKTSPEDTAARRGTSVGKSMGIV